MTDRSLFLLALCVMITESNAIYYLNIGVGSKIVVFNAGSPEVDGVYIGQRNPQYRSDDEAGYGGPIRFMKDDGSKKIDWFPAYVSDGASWAAAWYLEDAGSGWNSMYISGGWDDENSIPLTSWHVSSGFKSDPGAYPGPIIAHTSMSILPVDEEAMIEMIEQKHGMESGALPCTMLLTLGAFCSMLAMASFWMRRRKMKDVPLLAEATEHA